MVSLYFSLDQPRSRVGGPRATWQLVCGLIRHIELISADPRGDTFSSGQSEFRENEKCPDTRVRQPIGLMCGLSTLG